VKRFTPALILVLAASSSRAVPVPDCNPPQAYNGAQAWWMTQLPPPDEGGARTVMALVSLPVYIGCGVIDILAFPGRAIYNSSWRCAERDHAEAMNRDHNDEIVKVQQRRARLKGIAARTPPKLVLWAEFDDSRSPIAQRNNMLDAEEAAQLRLTLRNEGPGPAHDVSLLIGRESGPADAAIGGIPAVGDLPAGRTRLIRVPISATDALSAGRLVLRIEAKEELGYDADPVLLVVPTAALPAPDLEVSDTGSRAGVQELALGVPISLRLRVANKGEGLAREVKIRLMAEDGDINLAQPEEAALGDLAPFGSREAAFQLSLSKQYHGPPDLPVFAVLSEEHARFSKPPVRLPLRLGAKLGTLRTVSSGPRQPPKLEYDVSLRDRDGSGVLAGGKELALKVRLKNSGAGVARGVAVALSGNKALVELLGNGRLVGDMAPGQEETVVLRGTLPGVLPAKASLDIRVSEMLGYAPGQVKRLSFSFKSAAPSVQRVVDVDLVPSSSWRDPKRFAVVIGVGKHRDDGIAPLPNARHDAEVVASYLEQAGGVSPEHIKLLLDENALMTDFMEAFESWLPRMVKAAGGEAEVVVYYAGHGTPDPLSGDYQLVPFEGSAEHREGLFPLTGVYAALEKAPVKAAVVIMDSCFAGGGRSLAALGRPLIPMRRMPLPAHAALLAASSGVQTSNEKKDSRHGLFTYHLLAGLQGEADAGHKGRVRLGELADYLKKTVPPAAADELGATQEPEVRPQPLGQLSGTVLTRY
jgi:hypothetical protein